MAHAVNEIVRFKNPALIVRTQRPAQLMIGNRRDRYPLMAQALKMQRKGLIAVEWDAPRWNQQADRYELKVRPLRDPAPAWRTRLLAVAAALTALSFLGILAWRALEALTTAAGLLFLVGVLIVFAAWVIRHHRRSVEVTTTVTTKVRIR